MSDYGLGHHAQIVKLFTEHFKGREITGIEIGTAAADLGVDVLNGLPNLKKLYTIDPYRYSEIDSDRQHYPQIMLDEGKFTAYQRMLPYGDRVTMIILSSDEAAKLLTVPVDFVWVDGDHTEEQVEKDIDNYYDKVKAGGIFGGHDFHRTPKLLMTRFANKLYTGDDLTWWVKK